MSLEKEEERHETIALVIPARDAASTLERCLAAVQPLRERGELDEVIVVDDGSVDETGEIAARLGATVLRGSGRGPGAARNLGWKSTEHPLVWFVDSDCVPADDALQLLVPQLDDAEVAGAGGSYSNLFPESLVATLIHEEIRARHLRMPREVSFLATFNVLYRRTVLAEVEGFDEQLLLAQDADLAFRVRELGHRLRFEPRSLVGHHHPTRLRRYLRTQARQGFYRVRLYARHPAKMTGDGYSGLIDYVQPPLAVLTLACAPIAALASFLWVLPAAGLGLLALLQLPMTLRILKARPEPRLVAFVPFGLIRAFARGLGMIFALLSPPAKEREGTDRNRGALPSTGEADRR